jgi:hypothetical protein
VFLIQFALDGAKLVVKVIEHPLAQASVSKSSDEPVWFALKDAHLYEVAADIFGLVHGTVAQMQQVLCGLSMIRVDRNANAR